ncbi:BglG family transcription antiterminator [Leuconostoc pseudomesenteroides]|uniref:BglG family transcription antiterminator n=1 Tax=Leuconostoc pseudomesenteroides TaxID=33968 RepID=UPI004035A58A
MDNSQEDYKRQLDMAIVILTIFPKKISKTKLANKFYISESTLDRDLKSIIIQMATFNITFSKSGGNVIVIGTEVQVRKVLNYVLLENARSKKVLDDVSKIFPDISNTDQTFITGQMSLIEHGLNVQILDPYTINIFSHLYILLKRIRQHRFEAKNPVHNLNYLDDSLRTVSQQVVENISQYLRAEVQTQEIENLMLYLVGLRYDKVIDNVTNGEAQQLVDWLVSELHFNKNPINLENLKKGLVGHVRPMLHRISSLITVVNPLLNDIRFSYPEVFDQIKSILARSRYQVSDDEVGFLTLYVVRAIEDATDNKKVLLMCSSGIGTAQLLQSKVKHAFPNFEIVDMISARNYQSNITRYADIDLIISTISASNFELLPIPFIQVSALFNEGDKKRVEQILYG